MILGEPFPTQGSGSPFFLRSPGSALSSLLFLRGAMIDMPGILTSSKRQRGEPRPNASSRFPSLALRAGVVTLFFVLALPTIASAQGLPLDQPAQAAWDGAAIRDALRGLAKGQRVPILLDRRVDPGRQLTLTLTGEPLRNELGRIADQQQLAVSLVGPVVCFGPVDVERYPTLVAQIKQQLAKSPLDVRTAWLRPQTAAWSELAVPRELLEKISQDAGITLEGLDKIPHDLWAAAELPQLSAVERLTLVAGQFGLTFEIGEGGKTARLVPIPESAARVRLPAATGTGTSKKPPVGPAAGQKYKLTVKNSPAGKVIKQLVPQLGLELKLDQQAIDAAGISLDKLIGFEVNDVPLDELLDAMLKPAGLGYRRDGKVLEVFPAKPEASGRSEKP
jgi:hypothetical protein